MGTNADKIYDELLVIRCQSGDNAAFKILVQRWQLPLIKFATLICRDSDKAGEAVQNSWITVIKGINKLRDPAKFHHWALRIVHSKCIDLMRSNRPHETLSEKNEPILTQAYDEIDNQQQINYLLDSLSVNHRTVLALHYLQGLELTEISTLIGIPNGTVKSRLFHAKEAFRKAMFTSEELCNG